MTAQETADLRAMAGVDLRRELDESQRALFNLRFQAATRQLADVSQVRQARRRVARIRTLLREREILVELGHLEAEEVPAVATAPAEPPAAMEEASEEVAEDEPVAAEDAESEEAPDEEQADEAEADEASEDDEDRE